MSFGSHLRDLRLAAGKSLRETATFFGLSDVEYGELERDKKVPPVHRPKIHLRDVSDEPVYYSGDPCPFCGCMTVVDRTRRCTTCQGQAPR